MSARPPWPVPLGDRPPRAMPALVSGDAEKPPPHPYWCDDCGGKAAFTMPGCEVDHDELCPRYGEDAMQVYRAAVEYVTRTGKTIP